MMKNLMDKKGISIFALSGVVLTFLVIIIVASTGGDVLTDIRADQTTNGLAYNITTNGLTGFTNLSARFPLLGTIIIVAAVITVLVGAFAIRAGGGL